MSISKYSPMIRVIPPQSVKPNLEMTAHQNGRFLVVVVTVLLWPATSGLTMPLIEKNISRNEFDLRLNNVYAKIQPDQLLQNNISFTGRMIPPSNYTLDEKCKLGLPLSVRWTNYGPYASLVRPISPSGRESLGLMGIFPHVIVKVLSTCCHGDTHVQVGEYVETIKGLEKELSVGDPHDMMFPVGLSSMSMSVFKDLPVVPLLRAPRTTLVVPEDNGKSGKTLELFRTVGMAWPILVFIFLAAVLSGVFIWVLDHDEFPTTFISGVWEGFWWAVVTMTTVGYGDRAPRSILGRLYCVIWIVIGMSIIAIFTALITASLAASIQYHFVVHGSVMGAVNGSQEERIGTGMNTQIERFNTPKEVIEALVDTKNLEVVIMDNYLLSYFHEVIKREPVRVEDNLEHHINYGLVMAPNSSGLTTCFRRFVRNNPQDIFDIIRIHLNPLKNPTDDISEELKASQGFLGEEAFHMILYCLTGSLVAFILLGMIWEFFLSKIKCGNQELTKYEKPAPRSMLQSFIGFRLAHRLVSDAENLRKLETIKSRSARIRQLIHEYDEFYDTWLEKLKEVTGEEEQDGFGEKATQNNPILMTTYNGNRE